MSKFTHNNIYTYLRKKLKDADFAGYITGMYEPVPAKLPAVMLRQIGWREDRDGMTLAYDDEQHVSTWEAQVFSNKKGKAFTEAYAVTAVIEDAFKELFFVEDSCEPAENVDPTVYRLVSRFSRVICGEDEMPE